MTAASPDLLGAQLERYRVQLQLATSLLQERADALQADEPTVYAIDHAEEHIEWAVKELRGIADALESLRPYTVTGSRR